MRVTNNLQNLSLFHILANTIKVASAATANAVQCTWKVNMKYFVLDRFGVHRIALSFSAT